MDLFNYVMQTPQNTNPAVLSSEISKAIEESQVQADYAQNDPNKKDYIKNRPIYFEEEFVCNPYSASYGNQSVFQYSDKSMPDLVGAKYKVYSDTNGKGDFLFSFSSFSEGDKQSDYQGLWAKGEGKGFVFFRQNGDYLVRIDTNRFHGTKHEGLTPMYYLSMMKEVPKGKIYSDQLPVASDKGLGGIKINPSYVLNQIQCELNDNTQSLFVESPFQVIKSFNLNTLSQVKGNFGDGARGFTVYTGSGDVGEKITEKMKPIGAALTYPIFIYMNKIYYSGESPYFFYSGFDSTFQTFSFNYRYHGTTIEDLEVHSPYELQKSGALTANGYTSLYLCNSDGSKKYELKVDESTSQLSLSEIGS